MEIKTDGINEQDILSTLRILRGIRQFQRFNDDELTSIILNMKLATAMDGEIICMEQEIGDEMYIVRSGSIEIRKAGKNSPLILTTLGEGAIFGEMSLLDGSPRSASAIARGKTELLIISKDGIDDLSLVDEYLACNFLIEVIKIACDKIRGSHQRLISALAPLLANNR
jgi:CRP-like cAMP-binding protein